MRANTRKKRNGTDVIPSFTRTISKWGNSLGVRLPQEGLDFLQIKDGQMVIIEIKDDALVVRPSNRRRKWTSANLVKGVSPKSIGGEFGWGPPVGKEML